MHTMQKIIYTIGHSTRTLEEFIGLLQTFSIEMLADVRSYPGSRRYPHFNKENLSKELPSEEYFTCTSRPWAAEEKLCPNQKTLPGKMMLFAVMPTIWKQMNLKKE